jgi:hypothetical protein
MIISNGNIFLGFPSLASSTDIMSHFEVVFLVSYAVFEVEDERRNVRS